MTTKRETNGANPVPPLRAARDQMRQRWADNPKKRKKWSGKFVAEAVGMDQAQLSRVETGKARLLPEQAARLVRLFPPGMLTEMELLFPERRRPRRR